MSSVQGNVLKIVIIDDDASISFLLCEILKIWDHDVESFTSPVEAIKKIKSKDIDLVFTDYIMDELSGKDVFKQLTEYSDKIKVIITTALPKELIIAESGCEIILEKPFKMADVKRLIDSL